MWVQHEPEHNIENKMNVRFWKKLINNVTQYFTEILTYKQDRTLFLCFLGSSYTKSQICQIEKGFLILRPLPSFQILHIIKIHKDELWKMQDLPPANNQKRQNNCQKFAIVLRLFLSKQNRIKLFVLTELWSLSFQKPYRKQNLR